MKPFSLFILCICFFFCPKVYAIECCTLQGGSSGTYTEEGYLICKDETISYEATCKKPGTDSGGSTIQKKGCTNKNAKNYDATAKIDNGSCILYIYGCTDSRAFNYNSMAERDDGSCIEKKEGCTNGNAVNYNGEANTEDGSCLYESVIAKEEILPFQIAYQRDHTLLEGEEKILSKGKNGLKKVRYKVQLKEGGAETKKIKLGEEILLNPSIEVIQIGTKNAMTDFTILLYALSSFFAIVNCFYHYHYKNGHPSFLHLITLAENHSILFLIQKIFLYFCYIIFCISFIDFFSLVLKTLQRRLY